MLMLLAGRHRSPEGGLVGGLFEGPGLGRVAGIHASRAGFHTDFAGAFRMLLVEHMSGPWIREELLRICYQASAILVHVVEDSPHRQNYHEDNFHLGKC
jgi:hypothetical protein